MGAPAVDRYVPQLDGLRAIAVLLVLLTHFWGYRESPEILNRFAAAGWVGVDLFFVLSGFLITSILWDSRDSPRYFVNFYARRTLRIFPIYFLVLGFVFVLMPLVSKLPEGLTQDAWLYWLYLGNFAIASGGWQLFILDITWSLSIEEQFYLLWPALVRRFTLRNMVVLCVSLIVVTPLIRLALWEPDRWMWLHMMMPLRADSFAMGGLLAVLLKNGVKVPARAIMATAAPLLVGLIAIGAFKRGTMLVCTVGYTLTSFVAGAAIVLAMQTRLMASKPLVHIGKVSYGVYLYHPIMLTLMSSVFAAGGLVAVNMPAMLLQLVCLTAATVGAATLSYELVEAPLLRLKRHFQGGATPRVAASVD
jgi:peptidoglycan/LPS O-acetylase OafA/YrhL